MKRNGIAVICFITALCFVFCSCGAKQDKMRSEYEAAHPQTEASTAQQYVKVSLDSPVYTTEDWVNYTVDSVFAPIKIYMDIPKEWTLEQNVFYSVNESGEKQIMGQIMQSVSLADEQNMLDKYGVKQNKPVNSEFLRKSFVVNNNTIKLIAYEDKANKNGRYVFRYFTQIDNFVISAAFFADDKNADTEIFEHCAGNFSIG